MVSWAFGPTVSAVPSRNTRWARSFAPVRITSLACTSMPMRSMRSASAGGLPSGSPSVAEVTPTRARAAPEPARPKAAEANRAARRIERAPTTDLVMSVSLTPALEAPADTEHHTVVFEGVVGERGLAHEARAGNGERRAIVERDRERDAGDRVDLLTECIGVDLNVGRIVTPPVLGNRKRDAPGQRRLQDRVGEPERHTTARHVERITLGRRLVGLVAGGGPCREHRDVAGQRELEGCGACIFDAAVLAVCRQVVVVLVVVAAPLEGRGVAQPVGQQHGGLQASAVAA